MSEHVRLFVSFPEELVDRPMIYEVVKRFDVVPNIRRANVEAHSGWVILELTGAQDAARRRRSPTSKRSAARSTRWKATSSRDDAVRRASDAARPRAAARSERRHPRRRRARAPRLGRAVRWRASSTRGVGADPTTRDAGRARRGRRRARPRPTGSCGELRALFALDAERAARRRRSRSCGARTASRPRCSRPPASRRSSATSSTSGPGPTTRYGLVDPRPRRPRRRGPRAAADGVGHGQGEGAPRADA